MVPEDLVLAVSGFHFLWNNEKVSISNVPSEVAMAVEVVVSTHILFWVIPAKKRAATKMMTMKKKKS